MTHCVHLPSFFYITLRLYNESVPWLKSSLLLLIKKGKPQ